MGRRDGRERTIQNQKLSRRSFPREIRRHAVGGDLLPRFFAHIHGEGALDRRKKRLAGIVRELKAVTVPRQRVEIFDRVVEAAGRAHNRNRAVFEAVNLIEPARLIARRHQEHIGARFDLVRERVVETYGDADSLRVHGRELRNQLLIFLIAGPKNNKLQVHAEKLVDNIEQEIDPFLIGQPRDDAEQRGRRPLRQVVELLQLLFTFALSGHIVRRVVFLDELVDLGIPFAIVDAVQNAVEVALALGEHALEPAAVFRRQYLFGIFTAYRREHVGAKNPAFQKIDLSVKLQILRRKIGGGEPEQGPLRKGKQPLVGEIMNREDRFCGWFCPARPCQDPHGENNRKKEPPQNRRATA